LYSSYEITGRLIIIPRTTEICVYTRNGARKLTGNREIRYKTEDGEIDKVRLSDISMDIRDGSSFLDVALNVHKGVFDKQSYIKLKRKESRFVCIDSQMPRVHDFFGREDELKGIMEWFESEKERVLEVRGVAGIGKTAIVATAFKDLGEKTNILWLSLSERHSVETVLEEIGAFMRLLGRGELDSYLKSHDEREEKDPLGVIAGEKRGGDLLPEENKRIGEATYILKSELRDVEAVIVMDGCEKISEELSKFIGIALGVVKHSDSAKIILVGRDMTRLPDTVHLREQGISRSMAIDELDYESSIKILQLRGVESLRLEEVFRTSGGLPFFLNLMGPMYESVEADIGKYLEEQIFEQLSTDERRVLNIISVFDEPVHSDALFEWKGMKYDAIRSLIEKSLLFEISPMTYDTHDILKDLLEGKLRGGVRKKYHKKAGSYFLERGNIEDILRGVSHFISAGETQRAASLVWENGRRIIARGYSRRLYDLLVRLDTDSQFRNLPEFAFLKGECLSIRGLWDEAVEEYNHSLLLSEAEDDLARIAICLRRIAEIQMWTANYENVLEPLKRSAEIAERTDDLKGLTESYYSIAAFHWTTGDLEESEGYVDRCLATAKLTKDDGAVARAYKGLGVLKAEMGENREALKIKRKAIDFAKKSNDMILLGDCYQNLSNTCYALDKNDDALRFAEESLKISKTVGEARGIAIDLLSVANIHIVREEYEAAEELLDEATDIIQSLRDNRKLAQAYIQYGYIYANEDRDRADEFFKKGLDLVDEFGSLADRCEYYANVGHLYLWRAEEEGLAPDDLGLAYVNEASDLIKRVKEVPLMRKLERVVGKALEHVP